MGWVGIHLRLAGLNPSVLAVLQRSPGGPALGHGGLLPNLEVEVER